MDAECAMKARVSRVTEFGLCEVELHRKTRGKTRAAFTLDKLTGYGGQPFRKFGLRKGAEVDLSMDEEGRVSSARLVRRATTTAP